MPIWRFFGRHVDDAILRSPLDRIASNSCSWAYAGHFTGIWPWKGENTSISRLPLFCPGATFGSFSAGSKTTLSCTYPWTKLHQTRFLGFLNAIPQESSVGNGKLPVLADCPCFAPLSTFWRFFVQLEDDAVLHLPLDGIAPNSVPWAFARHSTGI